MAAEVGVRGLSRLAQEVQVGATPRAPPGRRGTPPVERGAETPSLATPEILRAPRRPPPLLRPVGPEVVLATDEDAPLPRPAGVGPLLPFGEGAPRPFLDLPRIPALAAAEAETVLASPILTRLPRRDTGSIPLGAVGDRDVAEGDD